MALATPTLALADFDEPGTDAEPTLVTPAEAAASMGGVIPAALQPAPAERIAGFASEANLKATPQEFVVTGVPGRSAIERDPDNGFSLATTAGRLDIVPSDVSFDASAPVRVAGGDAVLVANTATDADTLTRPAGGGIETFTQIRSADAPEDYSWTVALPGQESLRSRPDGGAEVVGANGAIIATVDTPWAKDATGRPVPTTLSVSGDTITMHVAHAGDNFTYPIVADPWWKPKWIGEVAGWAKRGVSATWDGATAVVKFAASSPKACGQGGLTGVKLVKSPNPWFIAGGAALGCLVNVATSSHG